MSTSPSENTPSATTVNLGDFDVVIAGAGMAGASLAYHLSAQLQVLLMEMESQPGYHTTGRSAALFSEIYGNATVRALSRASRSFFVTPDADFSEHALLTPRGSLFFADAARLDLLQALHTDIAPRAPLVHWLSGAQVQEQLPALQPHAAHAGVYEPDACDIDVHALHQGYLRGARRRGATVLCDACLVSGQRSQNRWRLRTRDARCSANVVVNAAGAWADELAVVLGIRPLGLTALKRTALVFEDQTTWNSQRWPLAVDVEENFYFKPDAGRLLASPADETPSPACDAQPDEIDLAVLIDRLEQSTWLRPKRITGRWAGLRTFAPDRTPVAGFDARDPSFFWLAGQGGYGIQTAPAMAQLSASLILARDLPAPLVDHGVRLSDLSPVRL